MSQKLIDAYANKISATYSANLAFFEEKLPGLHQIITTATAGVKILADIDENALLNFTLDGYPLPLDTLLSQSEQAMAQFESDDRPEISIRPQSSFPAKGEKFVVEEIQDPYLMDHYFSFANFHTTYAIDNAYTRRSGREEASPSPDFGKGNMPILIVFGSGYGSHLIEMLDRYHVRHLIIVDNDPAITRLSLGFTDYIAIYNNHLARRGTKLTFLCSREATKLSDEIQQAIHTHWPPYFLHGVAIFRNLRNIELCAEVEQILARDLWLYYRGWGFYDDELMSVWHSLANLNNGRALLRVEKPVDEKAVAFVVANGPSLDKLADLIRAHQGKAVVVSCGTALSALHRLGIVPDFHIEVERPYATVKSFTLSTPKEFHSQVRLVTPTVAHPDIFEETTEGYCFLKNGDTSTALFPAEFTRVTSFPTVSNGAVSMLVEMGFRTIYLCGVDLGARDPKQHHSKHSAYFDEENTSEDLKKILTDASNTSEKNMPIQVDANFGGQVSTNDILVLAARSMSSVLRNKAAHQRVYNLNDGAAIEGAEPLRPEDFAFPADALAKGEVVAQMQAAFAKPELDGKKFMGDLAQAVKGMVADLRPLVTVKAANKLTLIEKIAMVHREQNMAYAKHHPAYWMLRGSLQHMLRRIYEYSTAIRDEQLAIEFATEAFDEVDKFLALVDETVSGIDPTAKTPPLVPAQKTEEAAARAAARAAKEAASA